MDIRKRSNREFAMRIHTDIKSEDNSFYTDLNGFQVSKYFFFSFFFFGQISAGRTILDSIQKCSRGHDSFKDLMLFLY